MHPTFLALLLVRPFADRRRVGSRLTLEALGLVTFWVLRVSAIFELYFALELILSGRLVPIDLLPAGVRGLALSLPWYYAYGFPIELALGRADAAAIGRGFALQLAWGLVGTGLLALLWRCGVRRYAAVGG